MVICPNLKNPDVAREFNELKNATSEAAAYHIWSLNNGNGIDKAPNGAESKLFLTLLEHYDGDRTKAIRAKAKAYGMSFLNWFGDWTQEDKKNISKVVDENGEPLVVWHGSRINFNKFEIRNEVGFHFGTKDAADSRGYTKPFFLNIRNLERYNDGMWFGKKIISDFVKSGILTEELGEIWNNEAINYIEEKTRNNYDYYGREQVLFSLYINEKVQDLKGPDYGIDYINTSEDPGNVSYLVFNPNQIKPIDGTKSNYMSPSTRTVEFGTSEALMDSNTDDVAGELGMNKEQLIALLGTTMYKANTQEVAVKELFLNAFDAVKIAKYQNKIKDAKITVTIDSGERTVTVEDNGIGMTPDIVQKAFFTIGGSYKGENVDNKLKSGGLGFAKMAFLFSSDYVEITTIKDGRLTYVKTNPAELQSDAGFRMQVSNTNKPSGTTVTVKIPESYIDENGKEKDVYFASNPDFFDKPFIGDVDVKIIRKGSYGWSSGEKTLKNNVEDTHTYVGDGETDFGKLLFFIKEESGTNGSIHVKVLISGLYQFLFNASDWNTKGRDLDVVLNILPSVTVKSRVYPINNQREGFRATVEPEIKDIKFLLLLISSTALNKSYTASFLRSMSMDIGKVSSVNREKVESDYSLKDILKDLKVLSNDNKSQLNGNVLDFRAIRAIREENEKLRSSSFRTNIKTDKSSLTVDTSRLDINKPVFHNNTSMTIDEDGLKFLKNLAILLFELKDLYIQTYDLLEIFTRFNKDGSTPWGGNGDIKIVDYIKTQYWGFSFDKGYGGVNVHPNFFPFLAINPFYNLPRYKNVNSALQIVAYIEHLIKHEFNHNYESGEGSGFTGRFPMTDAEFTGIGKEFIKDWRNKLYVLIRDNLNVLEKYEKRYKESVNLGESLSGALLETLDRSANSITESNGEELQGDRSGEYVSENGERLGDVLKSKINDLYGNSVNNDTDYNLSTPSRAYAIRESLVNRGILHKFKGYRITKSNPYGEYAEDIIESECEKARIVPVFTRGKNSVEVDFLENTTIETGPKDEIERSNDTSQEAIKKVLAVLQKKVPWLKVKFISPSTIPSGVNKSANSFIKGDTVYLVKGRATTESTIEEFLHPIIYSIQVINNSLFLDLLYEAKHDFPKLWKEICRTYRNDIGFNENDRYNELVTQALSRYVHNDYRNANNKITVRDLVYKVFNFIARILNNAIQYVGGKAIITPENLTKLNLRQLSLLFMAEDSTFMIWTSSEILYNINSQQERAKKVSEDITNQFDILYKAYERMPNKSPRRQRILNEIFEKFNELKRTLDYHAVNIALSFALETLGQWNPTTNTPLKNDSVSGYLYKQSLLPEPFSGITPDILVEMYTNSIAFYENLLNKYIPNNIDSMMTKDDRDKRDAVENLLKQYIKPMWIKAMCTVGDRIVDQNIDNEVTASDLDKENMKIVAKDWLHKNIMYGDIKGYAAYIFNNSYSKNPIIKLVFHMIQHAETKTLEEMRPISTRITRAFLRANAGKRRIGPNWQTVLMEFNKDGIPTGNFVRDINYGQYEEDLTEFVKELNEEFIDKYNYTYVDDGTGVIINSLTGDLAENEEWGPNGEEPKYVEYLKRIEQWKCEHCNRRYTLDYYMERMSAPYRGSLDPNEVNLREFGHGLSPRTLSKYNYIQTNINYYLNLCTDPNTGFSHPEKLSLVDKLKLDLWQEELEKIQNPYDKNGEPKSYEDRQIAFEIRAWQKWLGEHLTTTIDYEAFQEEYDKIRQEALDTNNPRLISDFFRYNSDVGINPDFIELTIGRFSKTYQSDPAVIHANLLKGSILRLVKSKNGYTRNFQEVENNPSFWLDCKRIDLTIEDLREKSSRDFAKELDEKFKFEKILYRDVNGFAQDSNGNQVLPQDEKNHKDLLTYLQHLINEYTKKILASSSRTLPGLNDRQGNPIVFNGTADDVKKTIGYLFSYTREYTDWEGNLIRQQVPLSILTMMLPKVETFHNTRTNRKERTIINIPKGRFAEKQDEGGRFINKDYDQSKHISEQPKREYYDNTDAWEKVESDSNLKRLYDVLIDEMKNAQKNYQAPGYNFNYRLPQVNANVMLIWSRIYKRGLGNTLQALYEAATTVEENDEAMRTTEDYITSPDGSVATDVPLKYVRKLKNPENITTDVVGSVILFANMAINYKNKCEIDADIKALRYNIDYNNRIDLYKVDKEAGGNDFVPQNDKNSIKMFDSMTNKHVYGNQWSIDPNQLQENKQPVKNAWRGVASSAIGFGSSTAALGALIGLPFGAPGSGAILGGLVGGVLGGLQGAAANGLFEGIALFKGIKNMQRIETTQTLALNMFSMLVGFGDSMTRIFKESLGGKYLTVRDAIVSFGSVLRYTPQCIANIGNPLANNKLTRAMQLNGISKGIRQIFEHMNYGKVRRVASNLLMGGFSMLDWMANALLLRAFYNNVRFYDGNVVPKGFYTSYELTQAFAKAGVKHPKKQAWLSHFVSGTTLWDAYDEYMNVRPEFAGYTGTIEDYKKLFHFVGTEDELKDEYEQYKKDHPVYVTQRLKTLIRTKTMKRGALYNGMNPDNDIPLWKQDIVGGIIGSLRAWLAQSTQHLIAGGIDNIVKEYKTDVEFKNVGTKTKSEETVKVLPMNNEQRSMAFAWDYETGMPQDQIITGIIRSFKTLSNKMRQLSFLGINAKSTQKDQTKAKFSYVEKYAWKDALIYLGVLAAMMFAWTFVHDWSGNVPPPKDRQHASPKSLYPQDVYDYFKDVYLPNEYYKLLVDNLVFRTIEAQLTNIDPTSTFDVLTSVSALQNGVEEHFGIIKPVWDIAGLSGHKIDEVINRGSYKFYTRGERALYKFVGPLDNLHTFFSYYGITENEKFYTNTYGHIYRAFGYEFKKNNKSKPKQQNQEDDYGFGGGFDSGFDGGFDSGF